MPNPKVLKKQISFTTINHPVVHIHVLINKNHDKKNKSYQLSILSQKEWSHEKLKKIIEEKPNTWMTWSQNESNNQLLDLACKNNETIQSQHTKKYA